MAVQETVRTDFPDAVCRDDDFDPDVIEHLSVALQTLNCRVFVFMGAPTFLSASERQARRHVR
jgi:hypothetical protein